MVLPGGHSRRQAGMRPGCTEETGVQVTGPRVARHEKVIRRSVLTSPGHAEWKSFAQIWVERPGEGSCTACWVRPHLGQHVIEPCRGIIVAHVVGHVAARLDASILVEESTLRKALSSRFGILGIEVTERVMLIKRGIGHGGHADGVGVHVGVEARENLGILPFGRHRFVATAGRAVGGVLERPGNESGHVNDRLRSATVVGGSEQNPQSVGIGSRLLIGIVDACFVVPDVEVEEQSPPGDDEIVVG